MSGRPPRMVLGSAKQSSLGANVAFPRTSANHGMLLFDLVDFAETSLPYFVNDLVIIVQFTLFVALSHQCSVD